MTSINVNVQTSVNDSYGVDSLGGPAAVEPTYANELSQSHCVDYGPQVNNTVIVNHTEVPDEPSKCEGYAKQPESKADPLGGLMGLVEKFIDPLGLLQGGTDMMDPLGLLGGGKGGKGGKGGLPGLGGGAGGQGGEMGDMLGNVAGMGQMIAGLF